MDQERQWSTCKRATGRNSRLLEEETEAGKPRRADKIYRPGHGLLRALINIHRVSQLSTNDSPPLFASRAEGKASMHTGELHRCSLRIRSLRDKIGKRTVDRGSWHSVGSKLRESRWPFLGQMERREEREGGREKGNDPFSPSKAHWIASTN